MKSSRRVAVCLVCAALLTMAAVCALPAAGQSGATGSVAGKVVHDAGGQGIRKVIVELVRGGDGEATEEYRTATDASGVFRIEGIPEGKYAVEVTKPGFFPAKKSGQEWTITVEAGKEVSNLVYKMRAAGVISGKITDGDGDPLADVVVEAVRAGYLASLKEDEEMGRGQTNDLGEYRIANLKPGEYMLAVYPPEKSRPAPNPADKGKPKDKVQYTKTYYPGTTDAGQAAAVIVMEGGTATANVGVLSNRTYRVSGTVSGVTSAQVARLVLVSKGTAEYETNLEDGGKFHFENVQPGTYDARVVVMALGGQPGRFSMKVEVVRVPVIVGDSDVAGLELAAETGGTVKAKFRSDDNASIDWTQMEVHLVPVEDPDPGVTLPMQAGNRATLSQEGTFAIEDVTGGTYQLGVTVKSEIYRDHYVKSVLESGREVADTGFGLTGGADLEVVVSAKGATIEGTVVDADGKTVTNAEVMAVPASAQKMRPDAYQADKTNEQGQFTLRGMAPGQYVVVAIEGAHEDMRSAAFATKYAETGEPVELGEGEKKSVTVKVTAAKE